MAPQFIYSTYKLARFHPPDRQVLENISISFYPGAKIGVIGPNGAGKSSLLRIMAGLDDGFSGEARLTAGYTAGYLAQEPQLDPAKDVLGNVMDGVAPVRDVLVRYDEVMAMWGDPDADYEKVGALQAELEDKINASDAWNLERNVEIAMDALRCPAGDTDVSVLSGGERRRVALCRLLLSRPDLLLLDEPTNHLDAESVAWLERFLQEYPGTVVAVTHDRYFLDNVARWILELDRGRGIPFEGNYSSWLEQKQARLAAEEKQTSARQRTLQNELEWVRMAPKARQAKGKARLTAYEKLLAEAQADSGAGDRLEISIPPGNRLGDTVIEVEGIGKGYGDRLLIEDLSFSLPPAGIVGVIGPNGAGKTTLFNLLNGFTRADQGEIRFAGERIDKLRPNRICARGVGRTFQVVKAFRRMPIADNVIVGAYAQTASAAAARSVATDALAVVGLTAAAGTLADRAGNRELRLMEIARALAGKPALLLLDEVFAGLSAAEVEELSALIRKLAGLGLTLVIIEHTMQAMVRLVDRFVVLDHGRVLASGSPDEVTRNPAVIEAYLGKRWLDHA
jgi:ATP-binding cassette ChvD family protein